MQFNVVIAIWFAFAVDSSVAAKVGAYEAFARAFVVDPVPAVAIPIVVVPGLGSACIEKWLDCIVLHRVSYNTSGFALPTRKIISS